MTKRYFIGEDGASYTVIATSIAHAQEILDESGCDFDRPPDEWDWREMPSEVAAKRTVDDSDGPTGNARAPLTSFALGEWFCSEY